MAFDEILVSSPTVSKRGLTMYRVSGKISSDKWTGELGPATVYVRLLDTSRIDASALTVAKVVYRDVMLGELVRNGIEFRLEVEDIDPRARYEVNVLVDLDGDGKVSIGDFITTFAYPVLTRGHPDHVDVKVQRVS